MTSRVAISTMLYCKATITIIIHPLTQTPSEEEYKHDILKLI